MWELLKAVRVLFGHCLMGCIHIFHGLWILVILFGVGIVSLQSGLRKQQTYQEHLKRYPAPVTVSFEEFAKTQPKEGWYIVTGVTTNAVDAVFRQLDKDSYTDPGDGGGLVEKVIIPAYGPQGRKTDKRPDVVLVTDYLRLRKVVNQMQKLGLGQTIKISLLGEIVQDGEYSRDTKEATALNDPTTAPYRDNNKIKEWVAANRDRQIETRTVEGLIRAEEDLDFEDSKLYKALRHKFAPHHVILEEGITPKTQDNGDFEVGLGKIALSIGGVIVLFLIGSVVIGIRKGAVEPAGLPVIEPDLISNFATNQRRTYSYKDSQGNYHVGVDEQTLLTLVRDKRISMRTVVQVEGTGERISVSTLVKQFDRR